MDFVKQRFFLVFWLLSSLAACSAFEAGGSLNPLSLRPNSSLNLKAGSSTAFNVFVGNAPNLGLSPAALYRRNENSTLLSGSSRTSARADLAQLSGSVLPEGWQFAIGADSIEVLTASSSSTSFDTIQTTTRVELGVYSINGFLSIPKNTATGSYRVQARIDVRGSSPVVLEWTVGVTP